MSKKYVIGAAALSLMLTFGLQRASAEGFTPYEGKDAVQEGTGGAKKTVDGIDFWSNGAPPRKFQIIGFMEDSRRKSGLFGMVRMASLEGSIAKIAKEQGADAVILVESGDEVVGIYSQNNQTVSGTASGSGNTTYMQGSGSGTSSSIGVKDHHSKYAVVKYLPEEVTSEKSTESADSVPQVNQPSPGGTAPTANEGRP